MKIYKMTVDTLCKGSPCLFATTIYVIGSEEDLHLDPSTFYKEYGGSVPSFPHHELEVTEPYSVQHGTVPNVHTSLSMRSGTRFVCYPRRIESLPAAYRLFKAWAIGTHYTLVTGQDFGPLFDGVGANTEKFIDLMSESHDAKFERAYCYTFRKE